MLKFRSEAEVLKEWDDMIARVKAGEVSLEDAEAFKLKKGSSSQGRQPRDWGENARRKSSGICFYQSSITRVKWDRAMANRRSWGVSEPDDDEKYKIYHSWVRLGMQTAKTHAAVTAHEKKLDEAIAERRGFERGTCESSTHIAYLLNKQIDLEALKDELESELARVKEHLEENAKELEKEREKNAPPWWETYVPQERTKDALRKELIKKYKKLRDEDDSLVYASMGKRKIGIEDRRAEIMEAIWIRIPEHLRKGVFMSKTGEFSFEALVKAVKRDNPSAMAQTPLSPGLEKFGGQAASRAYAQ